MVNKPLPLQNLDFGTALVHLRQGQKIRRAIWKGYWFLASNVHCQCPTPGHKGYIRGFDFNQLIVATFANNGGCAPAQPYQADILAHDWEVIDFRF